MSVPEIQVLIPCHSLEDFPVEHPDEAAASLLNAFAVGYHPQLLVRCTEIPRWRRADDPPLPHAGLLVIIPTVSDDWLPHGWIENARAAGATVVSGISDRAEMLAAALQALQTDSADRPASSTMPSAGENDVAGAEFVPSVEPGLPTLYDERVNDFLALGTCWLLIELLTRRMRQFGNIDDSRFFQRAQAAAKAVLAADDEACTTHLRACFEMLLEARERFYPVECYLLDLCLAVPDMPYEKLQSELRQPVPFSLLISADDCRVLCQQQPEIGTALNDGITAGSVSLVGGEDRETASPLLPLESVLFHLQRGDSLWREAVGQAPVAWGRRRFALTALWPQLLSKFGYKAALHLVLDDGIYPDAEYTKLRWRGVDGTMIDAISRIPLAADAAASYLRFPTRMAESMDHDQAAGLIFARWPEVSAPWFDDFRRSQKYAPCLGRFVTLDRFFEQTELPGQLSTYKPGEYFSPLLIQHVVREEERPISRYPLHTARRHRFDVANWCRAVAAVLLSKPVDTAATESLIEQIEACAPPAVAEAVEPAEELAQFEQQSAAALSRIIMHAAAPGRGLLVINPLSAARRVVIALPQNSGPVRAGGCVKIVDYDTNQPNASTCIVEIPGSGYAWIPCAEPGASWPARPKVRLAEPGILRNELFEVAINERTGGIAHVRYHDQRSKRFSQQLSFRFQRERVIARATEDQDEVRSRYADMHCEGQEIVRNGTACGAIATWGRVVDQTNGESLATFRQTVSVWRTLPVVEIEIEFNDVKLPDGDPWNQYFASRFAWNDITAAVSRSILHSAHGFQGERIETGDFIEVASEEERLTIVPHGLPFHRLSGDRMVDSILMVGGESQRKFRFTIAIDAPFPLEAAWNATIPPVVVPTEQGVPRTGPSGWFFHLDSRHVQLTRLLDLCDEPPSASPLEEGLRPTRPPGPGFAVRLVETEGLFKSVKLRCFRPPTYARKRDFRGQTILELPIEGDGVRIEMTAFEIADLELRFSM